MIKYMSGESTTSVTKTGVTASTTYTVTDVVGNTDSTTVDVSSKTQKRTKSCSTCSRCEDAGSEWYWGNKSYYKL